jgi:hypothetical protein
VFESVWTWIVIGLVAFIFAVSVGFATRSLLGTNVGWLRTFMVGLLVFLASWPFAYFVATQARVIATDGALRAPLPVVVLFIALAFGWVFAFGIALLVATEALWPTTAANPADAIRAALHRRRRTNRYLQILTLLSRHGIGWILHERPGLPPRGGGVRGGTPAALVAAINEAGVTFVKLGQLLSTRRDLLPRSYTLALSSLQSPVSTRCRWRRHPWPRGTRAPWSTARRWYSRCNGRAPAGRWPPMWTSSYGWPGASRTRPAGGATSVWWPWRRGSPGRCATNSTTASSSPAPNRSPGW